jgi:hypothetical protein
VHVVGYCRHFYSIVSSKLYKCLFFEVFSQHNTRIGFVEDSFGAAVTPHLGLTEQSQPQGDSHLPLDTDPRRLEA